MTRRVSEYAELRSHAQARMPRAALILGSGLSDLADRLEDAIELPFACVSGLGASSVAGHRGVLLLGQWAGVHVLVFAGRLHYYEGHPWERVVAPVHIARELGASIFVATNAAGGIRDDLQPGDLMAICGDLDCTRQNWWHGLTSPERERRVSQGPLACAQGWLPYSPRLLDLLPLPRGVYAQLTGPSYETPAEIRMLRACGVDTVGMSTAREIEAAAELGMECAAISCITNKAAGLGGGTIEHAHVLRIGHAVRGKMIAVLEAFINRI